MSIQKETFIADFRSKYNLATQAEYGSAQISEVERVALRKLLVRAKEELTNEQKLSSDKKQNKLKIRAKVIQYLVQEGWPIEVVANASDLAQTAIYHACVVAEYLIGQRGVDLSADTIWSYVTKNQFDRFVEQTLIKSCRLGRGGDLNKEWHSTQKRKLGFQNPKVGYPQNVDSSKLYGVGKAHRYWPAQLMRNLEAIRLNKMADSQLSIWGINEVNPDVFTIPWEKLEIIIESATSIDEIAVNVVLFVMSALNARGLSDEQIINIVINSYSPRGTIGEHGDTKEVHILWKQILARVKRSAKLSSIYFGLLSAAEQRFQEAGSSL